MRTIVYDAGIQQLQAADRQVTRRWWGVMSFPDDGPGPFPVAVVLHGAHAFCSGPQARQWPCPDGTEVPNHEGLAYLTDALARRGFVAIAPGLNAEYALSGGGPAPGRITAAVVERDLMALATGQPSLGVPRSAVDTRRVVLVGHSRGGAIASELGRPDSALSSRFPIGGVVLIAPSPDTVDPSRLADVPAAIVIGTCDSDTGVSGGAFLTDALTTSRRSPVGLVLMEGATHNAVNDRLPAEENLPGRPGCSDGQRLSARAQQDRLAATVPELARAVSGETAVGVGASVFDRQRADDIVGDGLRVVHIDTSAERTALLPDLTATGAGDRLSVGFATTWCPAGRYSPYSRPGTDRCHRSELDDLVGSPSSLAMAWDAPGATFTTPVPLTAEGSTLVVRAFVDPFDVRITTEPVMLQVNGIRPDGGIWAVAVTLPIPVLGAPFPPLGARRGAVLWSEHRIVVGATIIGLAVTVRSPAQGTIQLVGLEAVRAPA